MCGTALPPAHLARVKAAEILRTERADRAAPAAAAARSAARPPPVATAPMRAEPQRDRFDSCLARLLGTAAAGRHGGWRRAVQPLQRVQRIVELEVLDALLLQLLGACRETRIGRVVALEQLVVDLGLGKQVPAKIGLADELAVLVVGVGELRDVDVGLDPAGLNRAARRRVITRRGQPQRRLRPGLDDGLDRALAEAASRP